MVTPGDEQYFSVLWIPGISDFHQIIAFSLVHHSPMHERAYVVPQQMEWQC